MPINRTPPPSPVPSTSSVMPAPDAVQTPLQSQIADAQLYHCESAPDLHDLTSNITERKKRKYVAEDNSIPMTIKEMFKTFSREQDKRFQELHSTISLLSEQNKELKQSVCMMSDKYDEFLRKINSLESERKADKKTISDLEDKLDALERKSRLSAVEIRNIPKSDEESKESLCNIVGSLGKILDVDIDHLGIKDIHRINSKDNTDPIIVDFTTRLLKDKFIKGVKKFNNLKSKPEKLNTTHVNPVYQKKPVYITESLTHKSHRLFYLARTFQKSHGYTFCWTTNGLIYLKKNQESPHIRIDSEQDINNLRKEL